MNVRDEIEKYSAPEDQPTLQWLFNHYHWESQWHFVARNKWVRYGVESYKVHRLWVPTREGVAIYKQLREEIKQTDDS